MSFHILQTVRSSFRYRREDTDCRDDRLNKGQGAVIKFTNMNQITKPRAALPSKEGALAPPPDHPMSAECVLWQISQRVFGQCDRNLSKTARRLNRHRRVLRRILSKRAPNESTLEEK